MTANTTKSFEIGDIVRVTDPNRFIASFAKKITDRDAEVVSLASPYMPGRVRVRFLKRGGRGKEFYEWMRPADLLLREGKKP